MAAVIKKAFQNEKSTQHPITLKCSLSHKVFIHYQNSVHANQFFEQSPIYLFE